MKRQTLHDLPVPDHRPAFWDDLKDQLDPTTARPSSTRSLPPWFSAVAAGAAVLAVGLATWSIGRGTDLAADATGGIVPAPHETTTIGSDSISITTVLGGPATTAPDTSATSTEPLPTTTTVQEGEHAPWSETLPATAISPATDAWLESDNMTWCSLLTPTVDVIPANATPRRAEFGGGWAVAWDQPGLRSAFGIAGTGLVRDAELATRWPSTITFDDGSILGYGGEGLQPANQRRLGELYIPTEGCHYQVWSELGDDQLVSLVRALHRVDGYVADPVELQTEPVIRDLGAPPWETADRAGASSLMAQAMEDTAVVPDALPTIGTEGLTERTATLGDWAVAWDAPDGPGHDDGNSPCLDCGRGVRGMAVTTADSGAVATGRLELRWEDGSVATIGYYVGHDQLPESRPQFRDRATGQPVSPGYRAVVQPAGSSTHIEMWSHLGLDDLLAMIDSLRKRE